MRVWGKLSKEVYDELEPDLQWLCDRLLHEVADISLICGHRNEEDQNRAFATLNSKVQWPNGRHNSSPSKAVDFQPYPYPARKVKLWAALAYVAGRAVEIGKRRGLAVRWGGDWNSNGDLTDQAFDDLFHIEVSKDAGINTSVVIGSG